MQIKYLSYLGKTACCVFVIALLFASLDGLHHILNHYYPEVECVYHYAFLNIHHKTQSLTALPYYVWGFVGLLFYTLFFRLPNHNHVIFYMNVMVILLLGCLAHDVWFRAPLNSFSKFVSHFMNGAFLLTAFNFIMITLIAELSVSRVLWLCFFTICAFIINITTFLIYFLFYKFIFGATSVFIFIFIFIFSIFQFNIMLLCHFLKDTPLYSQT